MFYVYLLRSLKDGDIYVGYSNDLRRRLLEHNTGKSRSTRHRAPFELVYYEAYKAQSDAKWREWQLKRHAQAHSALKGRLKNSLESGG